MFRALRKQITPATVLAFVALVFAVTGGAYAASGGGGGGSHATAYVAKAKKKSAPVGKPGPRGPAGPAGAQGPAGPQGPAGAAGAKGEAGAAGGNGESGHEGPAGKNGTNGTPGAPGANGESVTGKTIASDGSKCGGQAGVEYTLKSTTTEVCNGQTGFTKTLPAGETETGAWSFSTSNEGLIVTSFSFNIPLAKALGGSEVHYVGPGETVTECPGTAKEPKAKPGNLCVYQAEALNVQLNAGSETATATIVDPGASLEEVELVHANGTGTSGAGMTFIPITEPLHVGYGTWAVTAPKES